MGSILDKLNSVHTITHYIFEIRVNIVQVVCSPLITETRLCIQYIYIFLRIFVETLFSNNVLRKRVDIFMYFFKLVGMGRNMVERK